MTEDLTSREWITAGEASRLTGISVRTFWRKLPKAKADGVRVDQPSTRVVLVNRAEWMAWWEKNKVGERKGYSAKTGGHAPGHLRDALQEYLDEHWQALKPLPETFEMDGEPWPIRWLLGQLWNCTDVLPRTYYDQLELEGGQTYAAAVRKLAAELGGQAEEASDGKQA